ncbi:MAG: sulfotransferase [Dyadobacter sp.]|uniref:sulfotransferase family protein n=1 Tax=Dyadobacter sp. TaxID=1914288 RepID=UPI001B0B8A7B|nr:sulfotransferase [Dyadobacter sp.]MBO9611221.1 sulfotransferase [Dyadobacter sp.]
MTFTPVQIIGTQRSGSNLLRLMLNQLPEVSAPHPPHILERLMPLLPVYGDLTIESRFEQLIDDVCTLVETNPVSWTAVTLDRPAIRQRCEVPTLPEVAKAVYELKAAADGARIWMCKSMANIHYAAELEQYSTPPRYIHLFRDGRDVALSFKKAIVGEKHSYHLAQQWKSEQEASIALFEKLGPGRVLRVRYEDLLKDSETELKRICAFIGAEYSETVLAYHESAESRETANSGLMWQNVVKPVLTDNHRKFLIGLSEADIRIFERVAGDTLVKLDYELVYEKDETSFSARDIAEFSQINQASKSEFRAKLRPEDLEKRRPQEQLLKAIAGRQPLAGRPLSLH